MGFQDVIFLQRCKKGPLFLIQTKELSFIFLQRRKKGPLFLNQTKELSLEVVIFVNVLLECRMPHHTVQLSNGR